MDISALEKVYAKPGSHRFGALPSSFVGAIMFAKQDN
jgi:hypothetical protein